MLNDELKILLVEYAEGALDSSRKKVVEEQLKDSAELRRELQLIQNAFAQLLAVEGQQAPPHYFSNFLPRLREKLSHKRIGFWEAIPLRLKRSWVPAGAVLLIGIGIGLYYLLNPARGHQQLYEIVKEINQTDLDDVISNESLADSEPLFTTNVENVVRTALVESDFSRNILESEVLASGSLYDNVVNDGQILSQLDDDEVEIILSKLNSNSVR